MQINDVPSALFTWDNMHRAPFIDQHATILLLLGRLSAALSSGRDRPAKPFAVLPGLGQACPSPFPQNLPLELGER